MLMNFVADTHALLWWFTDSRKISPKASELFEKCEAGDNVIFIPSIVIIVATAKYLKAPIITKDKVLQKLPKVKTIW
jgi:PIN domain nuclease of toxin-antitoxin system